MSNDVLINTENVSKKFCRSLKTSLWYGMQDMVSELNPLRSAGQEKSRPLRDQEFWAVQDVSFKLRRGECLGLIGRNGAGKTTLLRMLNGLIKPDHGRIEIRGQVGALIALGAGFNPILTGRENVYVNGSVLGLARKKIDEKLEDIIDFADIREFIDAPVQSYSSGMQVRLGFAVATAMQPDILIVDEVLAVGDFQFQRKCIDRMRSLISDGVAVIFVSHNLPAVGGLCNAGVLLEKGRLVARGPIDSVVQQYLLMAHPNGASSPRKAAARQSGEIAVRKVEMYAADGESRSEFVTSEPVTVRVQYTAASSVRAAIFGYGIYDADERLVCANRTAYDNLLLEIPGGDGFYEFQIAALELHTGRYRVGVVLFDENLILPYAYDPEGCFFTVRSPWLEGENTSPVVLPKTKWSGTVNARVSGS